jgi:hypothetical protein
MLPQVKDAVFGNVGSIISFRMSPDDATSMTKYFEPKFTDFDLVHMHERHFVISMTIEGEKIQAFSAITLTLPPQQNDNSQMIIEHSREQYAISRESVERLVGERYLSPTGMTRQAEPKTIQQPASTLPKLSPASPPPHHNPSDVLAHAALRGSDVVEKLPVKPKRHRTRRHKSNNPNQPLPVYTATKTAGQLGDQEQIIKLR